MHNGQTSPSATQKEPQMKGPVIHLGHSRPLWEANRHNGSLEGSSLTFKDMLGPFWRAMGDIELGSAGLRMYWSTSGLQESRC